MLRKNQLLTIAGALALGISSVIAQSAVTPAKNGFNKFQIPDNVRLDEFMPKTIIVKVKAELKNAICSGANINHFGFNQLFSSIGGHNLGKMFPHTKAPDRPFNPQGIPLVDLTLVYEFKYSADVSLEKAANKFLSLGIFEYVDLHYIPHTYLTPNDPNYGNQWHLPKIKANNAWNTNTGSTSVVIGITDTGIDFSHPDLQANLKTSTTDPVGGGDQDGDGYLDNWRGWDVADDDNDPSYVGSFAHGVHVTGIAAASTNNNVGVAGVGYSCKYLPIKISDSQGKLVASYDGITYAADHGCDIINCSWGGAYGGPAGQDVITYAAINKNCLVVCAAGNDGTETDGFPASFKYAFSVANTTSTDLLNSSSQWGRQIDVCAPGTSIYATVPGGYQGQTGTSMASPCTAGAAAIVKSMYPTYTGLQVGERLRTTCDNINTQNTSKIGKIGGGRINLENAVTATLKPSVIMTSRTEGDNNDDAFVSGDTINVRGIFTNYLAPTTNLTCTLSSTWGAYVTVFDGTTTLGAIPTLGTANNNSDPFRIIVKPAAPQNFELECKLTYNDAATGYTKEEWFKITINVDYINVAINDVSTSITSKGKIGYNKDGQLNGLGFTYKTSGTLLYEAGLMIAKDTNVADAFRGLATAGDADFSVLSKAKKVLPAVVSHFDVDGTKRVDPAKIANLPITIHHNAYAWTTTGHTKYVMVKYMLKNTGSSSLNGVYAGIAADWDIDMTTFEDNKAAFDATNKMGYVYHTATNGIYAGIKLLSSTAPVVHYAIDNDSSGLGGVNMSDGYSGADKYLTMTTNRATAGGTGTGNDVIHVVSSGPLTIAAGDSVEVAFALLAGDNLADIQTSAVNAQTMYNSLNSTGINESVQAGNVKIYPNPTNNQSTFELFLNEPSNVGLALYNVLGEKIVTLNSDKLQAGQHQFNYSVADLASGVYYYQLTVNNEVKTYKIIVSK